MLEIILISVLFSFTWHILTMPGELLQSIARFINTKIKSSTIRKLLLCPYCLSGQISFWYNVHVCFVIREVGINSLPFFIYTVCGSILTTWIILKVINKYL